MPNWQTQGTHRLYCEGDVVFFELHGLFTVADTERMFEVCDAAEKECGYVLTVFDAHDGLNMSPEARRLTGLRARQVTAQGATLIIAASFVIRTVAFLLGNVARLGGKPAPAVQFCARNEESVPWIETQRQHFRTAKVVARPL